MKIPFSIDFKTQIESGEYKVETRDGRLVRIICWDRVAKENTDADLNLCVLVPEDGGETIYYYHRTGEPWARNKQRDLFIITPEQELTEFEKAVKELMRSYVKMPDEAIKESAAELLAMARKELEPEVLERLDAAYKNQDEVVYKNGKRDGKSEALKDLPRWRKWENGACGGGQGIPLAIVKRGLNSYELVEALCNQGEQYIMLSDLEKLPGFNE